MSINWYITLKCCTIQSMEEPSRNKHNMITNIKWDNIQSYKVTYVISVMWRDVLVFFFARKLLASQSQRTEAVSNRNWTSNFLESPWGLRIWANSTISSPRNCRKQGLWQNTQVSKYHSIKIILHSRETSNKFSHTCAKPRESSGLSGCGTEDKGQSISSLLLLSIEYLQLENVLSTIEI